MYIDEQRHVPRRIKWRHRRCVGGVGCADVLLLLALSSTSRQENAVTNISSELHKAVYFNCSPEISELQRHCNEVVQMKYFRSSLISKFIQYIY